MKFYTTLAAVAALFSIVTAQNVENPIHAPMEGEVVPAGKEYHIKWTPTTEGRVNLILRKGPSDDLGTVGDITTGLPNDGIYFWTPDADLEADDDYAIEIKSEEGDINYTGLFSISSENTGKDDEEDKEEDKEEDDKTTTTEVPYPSTTQTIGHNSTMTTGNSTRIPSRTPTSKPTPTDDEETEPTETDAEEGEEDETPAEGTATGLHSSMALVVCVLGAVLYLH